MVSEQSWYRRLGITHTHTPATTIEIGVLSVVLGWYAGWITAGFGLRMGMFVVSTLVAAVWLYRQRDGWTALAMALYLFAGLLVVTPILFDLAFVLDAPRYGISNVSGFVLTRSDLVFVLVCCVLAAIPAGLATLIRQKS